MNGLAFAHCHSAPADVSIGVDSDAEKGIICQGPRLVRLVIRNYPKGPLCLRRFEVFVIMLNTPPTPRVCLQHSCIHPVHEGKDVRSQFVTQPY